MLLPLEEAPPLVGDARDAVIAFLQRYADVFGVGDLASELVLVSDGATPLTPLTPGGRALRFAQRIPGSNVRSFGADTVVHLRPNGSVAFLQVSLARGLATLSDRPRTTAAGARSAAEAGVRAKNPHNAVSSKMPPELGVHEAADGRATLAWRVLLTVGSGFVVETFVDATSGRILATEEEPTEIEY